MVPVGQATQLIAPSVEYLPAGQMLQLLLESACANFPAGQAVHDAKLLWAVMVPAGQAVQFPAPSKENLPAGHAVHPEEETSPVFAEAVPPVQLLHDVAAGPDCHLPAGHASHAKLAFCAAYVPAAHGVQDSAPSTFEYVPAGHARQAADPLLG